MAGQHGGLRATIAALSANSGIAVAKFVAFAFTGSASMLAEGVHSVADTSNQLLPLLGLRRAKRPASVLHPFGYGRERYFWSFVVAIVLFAMGSLFSLHEGYEKLRHPHKIESLTWAIGVLVVAIGLEIFSCVVAVKEANAVRGSLGWWAFIRRSKSPELPVLLLEDSGALLGLVIALAGVTAASVTGNPMWDAVGSLAIGGLLGVIAVVLAIEMKSLLIGEGATEEDAERIRSAIESDADVSELIHVRTLHLGPDELLVAAKVGLNTQNVAEVINRVEAQIRAHVPSAKVIYVEPDVPE